MINDDKKLMINDDKKVMINDKKVMINKPLLNQIMSHLK